MTNGSVVGLNGGLQKGLLGGGAGSPIGIGEVILVNSDPDGVIVAETGSQIALDTTNLEYYMAKYGAGSKDWTHLVEEV